ncbi:MAG: serine hydrolase domain-containing protein [Planctomycetota bacterium]
MTTRPVLLAALTLAVTPCAATQAPSAQMARAAAAYAAKVTASALFVSERTLDSVMEQEFAPVRPLDAMIRALLEVEVDRVARSVTCRLGVGEATAVFHEGLGCSLVLGPIDPARRRFAVPLPAFDLDRAAVDAPWPRGRAPAAAPADVDAAALASALAQAFEEPDRRKPVFTRAVVVARRGELVAERYAPGFDAQMPLPGWSMTKTLVNALVGAHVDRAAFDVHARPGAGGWREEGDPRAQVRNHHLLAMSAGLRWNEDYTDPTSDALQMLLLRRDHAAAYAQQPAAAAPGSRYQYASGATNLLCRELRAAYSGRRAYWQMPARFFQRVGMHTAVLETDPSGTFVGSSYGYASARDWARLGQLFLQDGVMFGDRVLPEGWVARSTSVEASPASGGRFGWHIWLNRDPDGAGPRTRRWPALPEDVFHMDGHEGQYVVVVPSEQLVVVRLGCTKSGGFSMAALVRAVIAACR